MIPLKLHIKNFLSYGPLQTINFEPYHLICLSGKNGHGKSALLDAITWAVWGQARKISSVAKPDAQLLRLGQSHMMVIFDFLFNNQHYRIKREFTLSKSNQQLSTLEFGIADTKNESFKALTDKTMRTTQEKIESILGLDFESFVNSAFLRQGQSNEFSKKTPKERKEILSQLLQLSHYEELRKKAQDNVRNLQQKIQHLEQYAHKLTDFVSQEDETKLKLHQIQDQMLSVDKTITDSQTDYEHHQKTTKTVHTDLQKITFQIEQIDLQITLKSDIEEKLRTTFATWRMVNKEYRERIPADFFIIEKNRILEKMHTLQKQQQQLMITQQQMTELQQKKIKIEHAAQEKYVTKIHEISLEQARISSVIAHVQKNKMMLEQTNEQTKNAYAALCEHKKQLTKKIALYEQKKVTIAQKENHFEKRKQYYYIWLARLNSYITENEQLQQKQKVGFDIQNPSCPFCEQNLSAARKRFLHSKFEKNIHSLAHRIHRLKKIIADLKQLLLVDHEQIQIIKKEHEQLRIDSLTLEQTVNAITQNELEQEKISRELQNCVTEIARNEQQLKTLPLLIEQLKKEQQNALRENQEYIDILQQITRYEQEIKSLTQSTEDQIHIMKELESLNMKEQQHHLLMKEYSQQEQRKNVIRELCAQLKHIKKIIIQKNDLVQKKEHLITQEREIILKQKTIEEQLADAQNKKNELLVEVGKLEQLLQSIQTQKKQQESCRDEITKNHQEISDYQVLTQAFSKDGLQALLIEEMLPEIEDEANNLLSKLTNNQAHISIESVRDLKKGGVKETLDINISDPMGIRPYELFSGGEAFRIDFALRIALAKLLARRSGSSLQTLIIDEGFGSQDEEGLSLLMDGIHKIQDDFAKIIIVSHLNVMKEQFPVHFMVHKGPLGSAIQVVHND